MKNALLLVSLILWMTHCCAQNMMWLQSKNINSSHQHTPIDMAASNTSDANYIIGYSQNTTLLFGTPYTSGPILAFITKLNAQGDTVWVKRTVTLNASTGNTIIPRSITVDKNDNIYIAGYFGIAANDTAWIGGHSLFGSGSFILKYDSAGNAVSKYLSSNGAVKFNDIDLDSAGNIYIIGNTRTMVMFGSYTIPAPSSISGGSNSRDFLLALSNSGNVLWAAPLGELDLGVALSGNEGGQFNIAVTKNSPILIFTSGFFNTSYTFAGASYTGSSDEGLMMKFNHNGTYIDGRKFGGSNIDAYHDISINENRRIALAGVYRTSTTIGNNNYSSPVSGYCQTLIVSMDTGLNYLFIDTAGLGCGNYPHVGLDKYNRIAVVTGANGNGRNFLFFYDQNGQRTFTKSYTYQNNVNFAGMGPFAVTFPPTHSDKLYFVGGYKPQITIDSSTISASTSYCFDIAVGKFDVPLPCQPNLGADTGYCNAFSRSLSANVSQAGYLWSTNDTTSSITVSQPGNYWVRVTKNGCVATDSIRIVNDNNFPSFTALTDTILCHTGTFTLQQPVNNARSFKWWNNTSANAVIAPYSGNAWIEYKNYCGTLRDSLLITRMQKPVVNIGKDTSLCATQQIQLSGDNALASWSKLWSTNDTTFSITVLNPATYWLEASNFCGKGRDSIIIGVLPTPSVQLSAEDTFTCGTNKITLTATASYATSLLWNNSNTSASIQVNQTGNYHILAYNRCGIAADSVSVSNYPFPDVQLPADTYLCVGNNTSLTVQSTASVVWYNADTSKTIVISAPGTYWVMSSNRCGTGMDSITFTPKSKPNPGLGRDTTICNAFISMNLYANTAADFYRWSNGSQGTNLAGIFVNNPGIYWVETSNVCGSKTDSLLISKSQKPVVFIGNDTLIRGSINLTLDAGNTGNKYQWSTSVNDTQRFVSVNTPGCYWVDVSNVCGTTRDSIFINTNTNVEALNKNKILVYPNPAQDILSINTGEITIQKIELLTSEGKLMSEFFPDNCLVHLNTANIKAGIYILRMHHNSGINLQKIIISR